MMAFVDEEIFYDQLKYRRENVAKNTTSLTKQKYDRLIEEVKYVKALNDPKSTVNGKKTARMFWVLKAYDVIQINGIDRLICPNEKYNGKNFLHYIHDDELYNIIRDLHETEGRHIGRDRMMKVIHKKYKNITRSEVALYLMLCEKCQPKQKAPRIIIDKQQNPCKSDEPEIKSRCLINIIPFHHHRNKNSNNIYNHLMVYKDLLTNFIILRALKTNEINEICNEISDIFSTFGASTILQTYNGQEFIECIIEKLMTIWDGLILISGYLLTTTGNINNVHKDIIAMIELWINEHPTNNWNESLKYIQFVQNSTISSDNKLSPYEKTFGYQPKFGLRSSNLHEHFIENIKTEKQLDDLIKLSSATDGDNEDDHNIDEHFCSHDDIIMKTESH